MIKIFFFAMFAAPFAANAQSDTVGLYLGGNIWNNEFTGGYNKESSLVDLSYKKQKANSFFIAVEHPFRFFPNLRISLVNFDTASQTNSIEKFSFTEGSSNIVHETIINTEIDTHLNINHVDYTLYYQLLNSSSFSLDLGLTARDLNDSISVKENITTVNNWSDIFGNPYTTTHNDVFTDSIPTNGIESMLYIASNIKFPIRGLSLFIEGDFLLNGERTVSDYQVGFEYNLLENYKLNLDLTLGYRALKMEFEHSDDLFITSEIKGVFLGIVARF